MYLTAEDVAFLTRIMTRHHGLTQILRRTFELAQKNISPSVTLVEKPKVFREIGGLFLKFARKIAPEYPEVEFREANIDSITMWLVKNTPDCYVLVVENL